MINSDFINRHQMLLPVDIQKNFLRLLQWRRETGMPGLASEFNCSTIALLLINHREFWGANKSTAGLSCELMNEIKAKLKIDQGTSAHDVVLKHAEADALIDAYKKQVRARTAMMFIDRRLCGFCAGPELNGGSLRRLLPLLALDELKVYGPDKSGRVVEVTFTINTTRVSRKY